MTNPFVGPGPFDCDSMLFGRERELGELGWRLLSDRIIVLYSPSGAGKTSLLLARNGLLARVRHRFHDLPPLRVWGEPPEELPPGVDRVTGVVLAQLNRAGMGAVMAEDTLLSYFDRITQPPPMELPPEQRLFPPGNLIAMSRRSLLVIDQFEELFSPGIARSEQEKFIRQLGELLAREDNPVWLVLSMREEYFPWLDPFRDLVPTRLANTFRLNLLGVEQAQEAVRGPARIGGIELPLTGAEDAAGKLAADLSMVKVKGADGKFEDQPGPFVEPVLLQVICAGVLARKKPDTAGHRSITVADVTTLRQVEVLQGFCDEALRKAGKGQERKRIICDWIDGKLLTPSGLRTQSMIDGSPNEPTEAELQALIDTHLLREQIRLNGKFYELAHDSLAQPARASIEKWRERHAEPWQRLARAWDLGGRSSAFFGTLSAENAASIPAIEGRVGLAAAEFQFLRDYASYKARHKMVRLVASLVFVLVLVCTAGLVAWRHEGNKAQLTRDIMANQAAVMRVLGDQSNVDLAMLAAAAGTRLQERHEKSISVDFKSILAEQLNNNRQIAKIDVLGDGKTLQAASNDSWRVAIQTGDSRWSLTATELPGGRPVWIAGKDVLKPQHPEGIYSFALLPNGRLATGGGIGDIRIWDIAAKKLLHSISPPPGDDEAALMRGPVRVLTYAGGRLFAGYRERVVAAWSLDAAAQPSALGKASAGSLVTGIAPYAGGTRLAVSDMSSPQLVRLLSLGNGTLKTERKLIVEPQQDGRKGALYSVAVSPDEQLVVAGNRAGKLMFWDVKSGAQTYKVDAHGDNIVQLRFLDDSRLVSASWDGKLKLWTWLGPRTGAPSPITLLAGPRQLTSISLSAATSTLFVTTEKGDLYTVATASDRHPFARVVPATGSGHAILMEDGQGIKVRAPKASDVSAMASTADTRTAFSASGNRIEVWRDEATAGSISGLGLDEGYAIKSLVSSADGTILVARIETAPNSQRYATRIWALAADRLSASKCEEKYPADFLGKKITRVAFRGQSHDFVSIVGDDAKLWSVKLDASGCPVVAKAADMLQQSRRGEIQAAAFDPQGNMLYLANFAGQVYVTPIGNAEIDQEAKVLKEDSTRSLTALAVGQDGSFALGDDNGKITVFQPSNERLLVLAQEFHVGPIAYLSFSRDGKSLMSRDEAGSMLWDLDISRWIEKACSQAGRTSFTPAEVSKYFGAAKDIPQPCGLAGK